MPDCENCGRHVTSDFLRVFGVDGEVHGCPNCTTTANIQEAQKDEL